MSTALFDPLKTMARITNRVIVSYSGGKDSAVTLDLCCRYFKTVTAFHMHYVKGLSFQESLLSWAEKRYGITVHRFPHFVLSEMLRYGTFRVPDYDVPVVSPNEVYDYARELCGAWWIAGGERASDSIWRNAMLKKSGSIDTKRGRLFPVMYWSLKEIRDYIRLRKIKVAPEAAALGHSFRSLDGQELYLVRQHYPDDYRRILKWFPFAGVSVKQYEFFKNQVSEV